MTTKEKIIKQSVNQIQKRLIEIDEILNANPLGKICLIRNEAQKLLEENKTVNCRMSEEFMAKIEALSKQEKEQFKIAEKQKNTVKLIDEKVNLQFELSDLNSELYYIERKKENEIRP